MPIRLPAPLHDYFEALNKKDVGGMALCFSDDAQVHDEGHEIDGGEAVEAWIRETTEKYGVKVKVLSAEPIDDEFRVIGQVSGEFEGSPIELAYYFMIDHDEEEIYRLEIALPDEDGEDLRDDE